MQFTETQIESAVERINAAIAAHVEYEESHRDAGGSYAHLVRECWNSCHDERLAEFLKESGIETSLEIDDVSELVLENFETVPDSLYGGGYFGGVFHVEFFPIQEHEISLAETLRALGDSLFDAARVSPDVAAYIPDSYIGRPYSEPLAYVATDSGWSAQISAERLRELIADAERESAQ